MKVKIIEEAGFQSAMRGLARSYDRETSDMPEVALKLSSLDRGHNKFLESMVVWMDVDAPRYWWSEFDTYRVGMTKQSDSTMHTLKNRQILMEDFELPIPSSYLNFLNSSIIGNMPIEELKNVLPDGFIQGRTVCTNYKVIRHIIIQRHSHKLKCWRVFCEAMKDLHHYKYLGISNG